MRTISFTEFRKKASGLISDVENGEVLIIMRHGKPIAEVSPVSSPEDLPAWKRPALRLVVKGADLSTAILGDRANEDVF